MSLVDDDEDDEEEEEEEEEEVVLLGNSNGSVSCSKLLRVEKLKYLILLDSRIDMIPSPIELAEII